VVTTTGIRGSQTPSISSTPAYATTLGVEAVELAASCGVTLDP
jgi:hypothetical protein